MKLQRPFIIRKLTGFFNNILYHCTLNQTQNIMKKLIGLGLALLCLTACSSDDDSGSPINLNQLTKRWYNVSYVIAGKTVAYDGHLPCGKDYTEFIGGSSVKEVDFFNCQEDPITTTGTYTAAEKSLTTVIDGVTSVYTIKKLNSKSLEIEQASGNPKITYIYTSTP